MQASGSSVKCCFSGFVVGWWLHKKDDAHTPKPMPVTIRIPGATHCEAYISGNQSMLAKWRTSRGRGTCALTSLCHPCEELTITIYTITRYMYRFTRSSTTLMPYMYTVCGIWGGRWR